MATGYKTGGRKKGTPNKLTRELRDMILGALANAGGCDYLTEQAKTNPRALLALLGKLLPTQISYGEDDDEPDEPKEEFSDLEIARRLAFLLARGAQQLDTEGPEPLASSPPAPADEAFSSPVRDRRPAPSPQPRGPPRAASYRTKVGTWQSTAVE